MQIGYYKSDYEQFKLKIPVNITLEKKTSNILVAGKSGSGKSLSALYYIWNMLCTGESICYIADIRVVSNMNHLKVQYHMLLEKLQLI